jgi:hypothetical protein
MDLSWIPDLVVNLAASVIVFLAGYLAALVVRRWKTRRAKRFWRQFTQKPTVVALSIFRSQFERWETSGLVGAGDVQALLAFQRKWATFGGAEFRIESSERLASLPGIRDNLVCIGGPDANPVTRLILDRTNTRVQLLAGTVTFIDTETGTHFNPRTASDGDGRDVGFILRTRNPFNADRCVLVVAGSFGDGTQAAAELVCNERFERLDLVKEHRDFEILFEVEVIRGTPQDPKIVIERGLSCPRENS